MKKRGFKKTLMALSLSALLVAQSPALAVGQDFRGHWAATNIQTFIDEGLVQGYPDGSFRPDQEITRAEFIKWVNTFLGFDSKGEVNFTDVEEEAWFYEEVAKAVGNHYITGYEGLFKPNASISRQEAAVIIARIMQLESEAEIDFSDLDAIAPWSAQAVRAVVKEQYMQGYPDNAFRPQSPITRAEALVTLGRVLEDFKQPVTPTPTSTGGSSGGSSGGGGGSSKDTTAPTVEITQPTEQDTIKIMESTVNISGTATDNKTVVEVTYGVNEGELKPVEGLETWQVNNIDLHLGTNQVKVTAKDGSGNTGSDNLTVEYTPFMSPLKVSQEDMFVNEDETIIFNIALKNIPNIDIASLQVMAVGDGEVGFEPLATLVDDGDVYNGDDIAADGVYSAKVNFAAPEAGDQEFVVAIKSADGQYTAYSDAVEFTVLDHLGAEGFVASIDLQEEVTEQIPVFQEVYGGTYATELANWLAQQPGVAKAGLAESGMSIWYASDTGVLGAVLINEVDVKGASRTPISAKSDVTATDEELEVDIPIMEDYIGKRIAVVSPFASQSNMQLPAASFDNVSETFANAGFPVSRIIDAEVSVELFKDPDFEALILDTHGEALFNANLDSLLPQLNGSYASSNSKVVFLTGELASTENWAQYEADLLTGRLAIVDGYYAITPAFVRAYNRDLPGTIVYNGSCKSTFNDSLADAYMDGGARVYYGFDHSVAIAYDNVVVEELVNQLVNLGATSGEAYEAVKSKYSDNDKTYVATVDKVKLGPPACFDMYGNYDLRLVEVGLGNGSFEDQFAYWVGEGDARIISQLGSLLPQHGDNMAIISTGLGSVADSDSIIAQAFLIPEGATTLSLDYNVVSEEPMEYVDSSFDDQAVFNLITQEGPIEIARESVNASVWLPVDGINFDGGDSTTFQTGWKHVSLDVTALAGKGPVTLVFRTWDTGDSAYDTAALIDNVNLE